MGVFTLLLHCCLGIIIPSDGEEFKDRVVREAAQFAVCGYSGEVISDSKLDRNVSQFARNIEALGDERPLSVEEMWVLTRLYEHLGELKRCRVTVDRMYKLDPNHSLSIQAFVKFLNGGDNDQALSLLNAALQNASRTNRRELLLQKTKLVAYGLLPSELSVFSVLKQAKANGTLTAELLKDLPRAFDKLGRARQVDRTIKLDGLRLALSEFVACKQGTNVIVKCENGNPVVIVVENSKEGVLGVLLDDRALRYLLGERQIRELVSAAFR